MLAVRGQYEEGVRQLVRALEVVPGYPRPWTALQALFEGPPAVVPPERARRVLPVLERSAAHQPGSTVARYTLGLARLRAGDPRGALVEFETVLRSNPTHRGATDGRTLVRNRLAAELPVNP
jgi:hypothetical protein